MYDSTPVRGDPMPNLGLSELIILAIIGLPLIAGIAVPIVIIVVLLKRQAALRARVAELEASLAALSRRP